MVVPDVNIPILEAIEYYIELLDVAEIDDLEHIELQIDIVLRNSKSFKSGNKYFDPSTYNCKKKISREKSFELVSEFFKEENAILLKNSLYYGMVLPLLANKKDGEELASLNEYLIDEVSELVLDYYDIDMDESNPNKNGLMELEKKYKQKIKRMW